MNPLTLTLLFTLAAATDIAPRQNLGQVPGAALTAPTQVSPVTTYFIASPGAAGQVPVTYTQLFSKFPGQLPSPGVGRVGLGTLSASASRNNLARRTDTPRVVVEERGIAGRIHIPGLR